MPRLINLIGRKFGRLTVTEQAPNGKRGVRWTCHCTCGNTAKFYSGDLKIVKSCGCLRREQSRANRIKHGGCYSKIYEVWKGMKARCYNPNNDSYHLYGGRRIEVCNDWRNNFEIFRDWALANGYQEGLTIDRIDNDKGYSPDNCRWATVKENNNNRRNVIFIECPDGQTRTFPEIAEYTGLNRSTLCNRYRANPHITYPELIKPLVRMGNNR